jgi:DNA processing protein
MEANRHRALNFQAMVEACNHSEETAIRAYGKIAGRFDTADPLVLRIAEYAEELGVSRQRLSKAYYAARPAFEEMDEQVSVITWEDPNWPVQANSHAYCPRFLYVLGDVSLLKRRSVSVIGTRNPSLEGLGVASMTAKSLGKSGYVVTSGLARGIDGVAHKTALAVGIPTIAVIGTPLDRCYPPEHARLQAEIAEKGAVVSRFAPSEQTQKWFFLLRNRLMGALSVASVVVEDREGGGAVSQASFSLEQGKYLFVYRSAVENRSLLWPRRFAGRPGVFVIDNPDEIGPILSSEPLDRRKNAVQLDLFET